MALWAKIQTLNTDCQRQILSLYTEEHQKYKFHIEVRNLFAEVIENAVCGEDITSVDGGLDPYNSNHRDLIANFFDTLIGQLEERLGNAQSGDQFFLRHKLSEALANLKENKQKDPLGMYEHMRNRIKTEVSLVAQQEAVANNLPYEHDAILENIQGIKTQISGGTAILQEIRTNEEQFALHCNKKQEFEAILNNPEQLQAYTLQFAGYETRLRENLATLEDCLQQNIRTFQVLMHNFEQMITNNLNSLSILQGQIIMDKLKVWKHEQQQKANGVPKTHSVSLERLQLWCEELAELIWKTYEQLKEVERILQTGLMQTGNAADMKFVQTRTDEVLRLLQELLNHSLIVEEQPPQIIKMKTKFPKPVIVSMLVGKRLNIHMNRPELTARFISEDQAKILPVTDKLETIGEITNGKVPMDNSKDDFKRLTFPFRSLQLKTVKRTDRRGSNSNEYRVMEEKSCLYFECVVTVGPVKFKVSTISLPVVVISHGSQEALAVASISWDNAFGEIGRLPFTVPSSAPWKDVAEILDAKFLEVTGRGLTPENLSCLAKKAFRNRQPQPEIITWTELCKEQLPQRNFTFWAWFHAALKLIEKKETHLKELWKEGLITGFIEREAAESLISRCSVGTFLLRFSDSICGAITIALLIKPGTVVSLNPFQMLDLQSKKIAMSIKDLEKLKFLYRPTRSITKDEAFGKFYESENGQTAVKNPYVDIIPTIPDGENSNGSSTPVPHYDGSRYSQGSLPGLSPISYEQSHSPFFLPPASPATSMSSFQTVQSPGSVTTMGMDVAYYETDNSQTQSQNGFLYPSNNVTTGPMSPESSQGELETPLPADGQVFQFSTETFEDLIRVIQKDTDIQMEDQV